MPMVRRRTAEPVSRRRDRVRDEEPEEEEEEDEPEEDEDEDPVDATPRRRPSGRTSARRAPSAVRSRRVVDDEDENEDDDDDDEEEEAPSARHSKSAKRARPARHDDDDDDDEKPTARSRRQGGGLPPGLKVGLTGATELAQSSGGAERLQLQPEPILIKCLENGPFVSFRQHWVGSAGGANRPYTCVGAHCPLCEAGDNNPAKTFWFNVLQLSGTSAGPVNKVLPLGQRAFRAWSKLATGRGEEEAHFDQGFWAINRTGKQGQSQTNFQPVKQRDLEEDWPELEDSFSFEDLPAILKSARKEMFDHTVVQVTPVKELRRIAEYLTSDED